MSDQPQRTNNYNAEPTSQRYQQCLFDWLVAHAPLWNQINYRRRQAYFNDNKDVWNAEYSDLYDEYAPILGKATCQQIARKNADAWRSFFIQLEQYREGETAVYHARPEFERFQRYSQQIAQLQSALPEGEYSSERIRQLYSERSEKRDHSRDAAVRHATDWLLEQNVDTVYVGNLSDVLESHWSSTVNEKTHSFWSHGQLTDRVELTMGDVGINVVEVSEQDSSSKCPECGSENVHRNGDEFGCRECGLEAHSDVVGAWNLLQDKEGSMARPAVLRAERRRNASQSSSNTANKAGMGAYWEWDDWRLGSFEERLGSTFAVRNNNNNQTSISEPASSQLG